MNQFARDVASGLKGRPKTLPPKHLYDALGSRLFEAICELPWYGVARAERRLLRRYARAVPEGTPSVLVELGPGDGEKLAIVAAQVGASLASIHMIDLSKTALERAAVTLSQVSPAAIEMHHSTFEGGLDSALRGRGPSGPTLIMLLGSTIGNYEPADRQRLLRRIRRRLRPSDALLLGADLVKPASVLRVAYDDPLGVTAAFNKNVLARINRELGGEFDLTRFDHRAVWNATASRVEMHLVSRTAQRVWIARLQMRVGFRRGESIWTESSYKFRPNDLVHLGDEVELRTRKQWIDRREAFALTLYGTN
jgi:dimethylhistidine N-methyltransferase